MADFPSDLPSSVTIGELTFAFPWIGLVPRPSEEEYLALRASIAESGIVEPVVIAETDSERTVNVINGHTRLVIAAELGLILKQVPWSVKSYPSEEEAMVAAVLSNTVRREWTRERRLATVKHLFGLQWPQRRIARALGVDHSQVKYDLRHLGLIPQKESSPTPASEALDQGGEISPPVGEHVTANDTARADADPAPPAADDDSPWDFPTPEQTAAILAGEPIPTGPGSDAIPAEAAAPPPAESVADRRVKAIRRGMDHLRGLQKAVSELNVYDRTRDSIAAIRRVLDDLHDGRA